MTTVEVVIPGLCPIHPGAASNIEYNDSGELIAHCSIFHHESETSTRKLTREQIIVVAEKMAQVASGIEMNNYVKPLDTPPGLYRVFWKSGGDSLASVGVTRDGGRWLAPTNWVSPTSDQSLWELVARLETIES